MVPAMDHAVARFLWRRMEGPHAFVYFVPEVGAALDGLGLERIAQYFAQRSAPMGRADPDVVASTFYYFDPGLVARGLRNVWSVTTPDAIVAARADGAAAALDRMWADADLAPLVVEASGLAARAVEACEPAGRPLFAAHASLEPPDHPAARLWHWLTLLREYRGDGHVTSLVAHDMTPLAALLTSEGSSLTPLALLRKTRGWSEEAWSRASADLTDRGWLTPEGALSDEGTSVRWEIEELTNRLAMPPWEHLGETASRRLGDALGPLAVAIVDGGGLPGLLNE